MSQGHGPVALSDSPVLLLRNVGASLCSNYEYPQVAALHLGTYER